MRQFLRFKRVLTIFILSCVLFIHQNCSESFNADDYASVENASGNNNTNNTSTRDVLGAISGITTASTGQMYIHGWACARTLGQSITVQLFAGTALRSSVLIGSVVANQTSNVMALCQTNSNSYGFLFPVSQDIMRSHGGKGIFAIGVSPVGLENKELTAGGNTLKIPSLPRIVEIHRFYSFVTGEHFYTLDQNEGLLAGYFYEGIGFHVFESNIGLVGAELIYRCYIPASLHFISTDPNCENAGVNEGAYGYVNFNSDIALTGSRPLHRYYNPSAGDHFYTTDRDDYVGYILEDFDMGLVPIP